MESIKVVVADDDDSVRHGLTALLHSDPRFEVVGHAETGASLLEIAALTRPHVVLMDIRMPGGGVEVAQSLASSGPMVVVAVSAETSVDTVVGMLRAGVGGYLLKGGVGASLPDLIARCADGEVMLAVPTASQALRQLMSGRSR